LLPPKRREFDHFSADENEGKGISSEKVNWGFAPYGTFVYGFLFPTTFFAPLFFVLIFQSIFLCVDFYYVSFLLLLPFSGA
jgi:hypothetical protein